MCCQVLPPGLHQLQPSALVIELLPYPPAAWSRQAEGGVQAAIARHGMVSFVTFWAGMCTVSCWASVRSHGRTWCFLPAGWWQKEDFVINELNVQSVITSPGHDEIIPLTQEKYTVKGYAYSGGLACGGDLECHTTWGACSFAANQLRLALQRLWPMATKQVVAAAVTCGVTRYQQRVLVGCQAATWDWLCRACWPQATMY